MNKSSPFKKHNEDEGLQKGTKGRKFTEANLHELLNELISETSSSDENEPEAPAPNQDSESTLLVNSTSASAINPGDIRKLMSTPGKNKDVAVKKQAAHELTMSGNIRNSKQKEKSTSVSLVALALVTSVLASNAHSHSSLRPKRRFHNAPFVEKIFPQEGVNFLNFIFKNISQ